MYAQKLTASQFNVLHKIKTKNNKAFIDIRLRPGIATPLAVRW